MISTGMIDDMRVYDRALKRMSSIIYSGDLEETLVLGGEDPVVTIFWGDEDTGKVTNIDASSTGWDTSIDLGVKPIGGFEYSLDGLQSRKIFISNSCGEFSR